MSEQRIAAIREKLERRFGTEDIVIQDKSHLHAGHAGAQDGRGHFSVRIVSPAFAGLSRIQRHREVFAALGGMMETDIHALSVAALTPVEAKGPDVE